MLDNTFILLGHSITLFIILYIQIRLPKFNRGNNIILGIKVPKDKVDHKELDSIYSSYKRQLLIVGVPFIIIFTGIGLWKDILNHVFLVEVLYVLTLFLVYLKHNKKVKELKEREKWSELAVNVRVVDTKHSREREKVKNIFQWAKTPLLIVLANIAISIYMYPKLPLTISALWGFSTSNPTVLKSPWAVFRGVGLQLFIIIIVYIPYYSMCRSRMDIDPDNIEGSIEANKEYVNKWGNMLLWNLVVWVLVFSFFNMHVLGFIKINSTFLYMYMVLTYIIIIINIYLTNKFIQNGGNITVDSIYASQYYIEDDDLWKIGNTVYYNPNDPANFVKSRLGPGYTVNAARPLGKIVIALAVSIIALAILLVINTNFVLDIINSFL